MEPELRLASRASSSRRRSLLLIVGLLVAACAPSAAPATSTPANGAEALFDDSTVHDISLEIDGSAFDRMLTTYLSSGEKSWIEATVTIDGATYRSVGIRLKGNSSLRGITADSDPATLPWLVDLDQFVDEQAHDGTAEFVVRANSTSTGLNEALALELLERAGLASQASTSVRFTVNGGSAVLRLVVENPDDSWMEAAFDGDGALYKAESTGDYSYRGEDPADYADAFDQEAGRDTADLTPLIAFLEFINTADDATFEAEIEGRLDVDSFATYLAMQELLDNFDDIDGPGNNSYLYYDATTGAMTVVPWDYNLAFGARFGRPGDGDAAPIGEPGQDPRQGQAQGAGPRPGGSGGRSGSNVLVERFLAIPEYQTLVDARVETLRAELYTSGVAADILAERVAFLEAEASDLASDSSIAADVEQIADQIS